MRNYSKPVTAFGQTSMEYLLLLGLVAFIVFMAFAPGGFMQRVKSSSTDYFTKVGRVIHGENPTTGINGGWCEWSLCNGGVQFRTCECPAPAFGGNACLPDGEGGNQKTCAGAALPSCTSGQQCNRSSAPCACPSGTACNTSSGFCTLIPTACATDQDCTSTAVPCYCQTGQTCNTGTTHCETPIGPTGEFGTTAPTYYGAEGGGG